MKSNAEILASLYSNYKNKKVVVTGGASFIGSHLVDRLLDLGAKVSVIDDLSSGKLDNIATVIKDIKFHEIDLRKRDFIKDIFKACDIVFHLAAIHGGRGFIESRQREILDNFNIDTNIFRESRDAEVGIVVHASSACVYPIDLQASEEKLLNLEEIDANLSHRGGAFPDGVYGWTKLMGELQLEQFCQDAMYGRSARIFTAYGERENLSHAAIALIAKSLLRIDPYPVWGSGQQTRNFTYVADTVAGLLLLGSHNTGPRYDVFNLGTNTHVKVIDFIKTINNFLEWKPNNWDFQMDRPTGVSSRASSNTKILEEFDWMPKTLITEGIKKTLDWCLSRDNFPKTTDDLNRELMTR